MSEANVKVVRMAFDAVSVGGTEAGLPFFADDVILYPIAEWAEDPAYHGHDGVRRMIAIWTHPFEDFAWDVHEIREVDERVLVRTEMTGRINGSVAPIRERYSIVCSDFRNDTIGEVRFFQTWQEALEAVGLEGR